MGKALRSVVRRGSWFAAMSLFVLLCACADTTPLSFQWKVNYPPQPALVTQGDYFLTGALNLHLADEAGFCGHFSRSGFHYLLASLDTDDGDRSAVLQVTISGAPAAGRTYEYPEARIYVQLSNGAPQGVGGALAPGAAQGGLDESARTFIARVASVKLDSPTSGRVTATLRQVKLEHAGQDFFSAKPVPGSGPIYVKGSFSCVAR